MNPSLYFSLAFAFCLLMPLSSTAEIEEIIAFDPAQGELPESVALDKDGNLYLSMSSTVRKLTPDGQLSVFGTLPIPVFALGVKVGPDGCVYTVSTSLDPAVPGAFVWRICSEGVVEQFAALDPAGGPNDLAFDDAGNLYVTDPFLGLIWRVTPDGAPSVWLSHPLLEGNPDDPALLFHALGADGIAFDKKKENLYVGNLDFGTILRVPFLEDGSPGEVEVFVSDQLLVSADGIAFDKKGNLYVTVGAQNRLVSIDPSGAITVLGEGGPLHGPSSVAFGTVDGDKSTLYITNLDFLRAFGFVPGTPQPGLLKLERKHNGLPLP